MKSVGFEMSACFYQPIRRHISEDRNLHSRRRENFVSRMIDVYGLQHVTNVNQQMAALSLIWRCFTRRRRDSRKRKNSDHSYELPLIYRRLTVLLSFFPLLLAFKRCPKDSKGCVFSTVGRNAVVGAATRYGVDGPGIKSRWGRDFPYPSRPTLGSNQPLIQWVPSLISRVKAAGAWRWPSAPI